MTQSLNGSRKRVRNNNCEEECCDFMPLSKRINNLHINNGNCLVHSHSKHCLAEQNGEFEQNHWNSIGGSETPAVNEGGESHFVPVEQGAEMMNGTVPFSRGAQQGAGHLPPDQWISQQVLSQYNPALDSSDNPFYYENNKLLFALYMERLQRGGQQLY